MKLFDDRDKMLVNIRTLIEAIDEHGITLASSKTEKTKYSKPPKGKTRKHKGGHPPLDYSIIEMKVSLEELLPHSDEPEIWAEILRLYYRLRLITNI